MALQIYIERGNVFDAPDRPDLHIERSSLLKITVTGHHRRTDAVRAIESLVAHTSGLSIDSRHSSPHRLFVMYQPSENCAMTAEKTLQMIYDVVESTHARLVGSH